MNTHKRRRLDQASATLARPFRSPLKASTTASELVTDTTSSGLQGKELTDTSTSSPISKAQDRKLSSPIDQSSPQYSPNRSSHISQGLSKPRSQIKNTNLRDPTILALQKQHASLNAQSSKLTNNLDALIQTYKIATSSTDVELEELITKWRSAARGAAEELFSTAKDRVNKMGGVGAWKEKMAKQTRPFGGEDTTATERAGWNNVEEGDIDEDELDEEQKGILEAITEERRRDQERYGHAVMVDDDTDAKPMAEAGFLSSGNDDDSFTMDMMLQQLNVDLDIIGYDKQLQRWLD